jgi:dipeptidyl aminopeptidase/acylaminoacyl peptidase
MKPRKFHLFIGCIAILGISLSCSLPALTNNAAAVSTSVAATLAAQQIPTETALASPQPVVVPTTTPEPIPTPQPAASRHPSELRVAFIGPDRNVYSWSQSSGAIKILEYGDASDLKISEDGQLIAVSRVSDNNQSSLWVVGFDGSNPRELLNWTDLTGLKSSPDSLGSEPNNLQWIPGTHMLTFSTREVFEGPGMALNDDLVVADADKGGWYTKLKPGQAGLVTYSPDGRWMAVSTAEKVTIMDTNGNPSPAGVLQFSPVITYSEYRYYPAVQWSPDGSRLAVVIPAADPLGEPRQPASVWTMNVSGGDPILQAQVIPQFIGPVSVSPDLTKMFYVKEVGAKEENRREIRTAMINGQNDRSVFSGGIPNVWDWNPNSEVFAFQTDSTSPVTVSQMNGSVGDLQDTQSIKWFKWVDSQIYLFIRDNGGNEEIVFGKWGEGSFAIAALPKSDMFRMQVDFAR